MNEEIEKFLLQLKEQMEEKENEFHSQMYLYLGLIYGGLLNAVVLVEIKEKILWNIEFLFLIITSLMVVYQMVQKNRK